jgi:hypothetical protein
MNSFQRSSLFLIGCMGLRIGLTVLSAKIDNDLLPYVGIVTILISLSLFYRYFSNTRLIGAEAGGVIWWKKIRIVHAILYMAFSILAFLKFEHAWIVLGVDVVLGFTFWFLYRQLGITRIASTELFIE